MLARVQSSLLQGIDAVPCEVEVDHDRTDNPNGNDRHLIVGLPDAAVKESLERVRSAMLNSGYCFPAGRILINLAPADVRKEGPVYDLPIATGMLLTQGIIAARAGEGLDHRRYIIAGELALDGRVRPVRGVIAMAALARARGLAGVIVPQANAAEASVVEGVDAIGVGTLAEVVGLLNGQVECVPTPPADVRAMLEQAMAPVDFGDVRGQEAVKRAITVAAAGMHNILMLGPPGSGKTMMARALPGVLPPLTAQEAIEITRIYSAAGELAAAANAEATRVSDATSSNAAPDQHQEDHRASEAGTQGAVATATARKTRAHKSRQPDTSRAPPERPTGLITLRPVRTPHHTASSAAIVGGGTVPRPGEISLAHNGVLFMDELAEFPRAVLETLRQPLEDGCVTIARSHAAVRFPARFMFVAAMNPTPKGEMAEDEASRRAMDRYLARLSGPLIDRIDIHVEAPAVPWKQLSGSKRGTTSAQMRDQVMHARRRQHERQGIGSVNSALSNRQLDAIAPMSTEATHLLGRALTELGLSARAYDKIRRIARTIADLDGQEKLSEAHIAEAVQYRLLDRKH